MTETDTLTVRLDEAMIKRLDAVAKRMHRSKLVLAAGAIEEFVSVAEWQIEAIDKGIVAADRGELVSQDKVKVWAASLGSNGKLPLPRAR
jgi:predicted transcriptional regulator